MVISDNIQIKSYDIPDSWDITFGDSEALQETRFSSLGYIINLNVDNTTLKSISNDFLDAKELKINFYNNSSTLLYQVISHKLIYCIRKTPSMNNFMETLYFAV